MDICARRRVVSRPLNNVTGARGVFRMRARFLHYPFSYAHPAHYIYIFIYSPIPMCSKFESTWNALERFSPSCPAH